MFDKSTKTKEDRMCKIAIKNAGMKQDDIERVLNVSQNVVSRPLKERIESGSIRRKKRFTLILECKEVTGTSNSQKYQDQILESGVRPALDSMVLRDDIERPHFTGII